MGDDITIALKGQNGKVIGSSGYFGALNAGILACLMQDYTKYNYHQALQKSADRIHSVLEEIYQDLKTNIGVLRYIPSNDRNKLIGVIESYKGLCKLVSKSTGKSAECIGMLKLSSAKTRPASKASESAIDTAVKTMRSYSGLSVSERFDVAKKVITRGITTAIGNNAKRALFLKQVEQGKGADFLADACLKFLYLNNPKQFKGRCGRPVCSDFYVLYFKKRIFFRDIPKNILNSSKTYDKIVLEQFKSISCQIERDLADGQNQANILSPNYRKNIMEAAKEIDRFLHRNLHIRILQYFNLIPIEDVTDRLHKLMESSDATYAYYSQPSLYASVLGTAVPIRNGPVTKIIKFILSVGTGSVTDLKNTPEWQDDWYIYEGDIVKKDATGNILFGYVGKVFGYDDEFLCAGAGAYQIKSLTSDLRFVGTYFDDPYDNAMIRRGISYYNKTH